MGIDVDQVLRLGKMHGPHDLEHALPAVAVREIGVDLQHLSDLVSNRHHRV